MPCPHCRHATTTVRKGYFPRKNLKNRRFQRFLCQTCRRYFSETTGTLAYCQKRPELHKLIFVLLNSSVSQQRTALIADTTPVTAARKLVRLAHFARQHHERWLSEMPPVSTAVFDDMETFEHDQNMQASVAADVVHDEARVAAAVPARHLHGFSQRVAAGEAGI